MLEEDKKTQDIASGSTSDKIDEGRREAVGKLSTYAFAVPAVSMAVVSKKAAAFSPPPPPG